MRDRLIELIGSFPTFGERTLCDKWMPEAIERLADHLLAAGVIVPPCKVGDVVYKVVADKRVKHPYECKVAGLWCSADEKYNDVYLVRCGDRVFHASYCAPWTEFGKTAFLAKEEAEAEMERMCNDEAK